MNSSVTEANEQPAVATAVPALAADLTLVVPTFNERDNVPLLLERLVSTAERRELFVVGWGEHP